MADLVSEGSGCSLAVPAATKTEEEEEEEYECKICYNDFDLDRRVPKLLSCSHTFCQECLGVLHSREGGGWRIGCPVCRHRTPVRENKVQNLPDNSSVSEKLPLQKQRRTNCPETEEQPDPSASSETESERCETCKHVAFTTGCVCAMLSFLSMVALLFVGLIFIHNFNHTASHVGPVCLFIASVLAPFSLILTWLMCMLKYRPEAPDLNSPTSNIM